MQQLYNTRESVGKRGGSIRREYNHRSRAHNVPFKLFSLIYKYRKDGLKSIVSPCPKLFSIWFPFSRFLYRIRTVERDLYSNSSIDQDEQRPSEGNIDPFFFFLPFAAGQTKKKGPKAHGKLKRRGVDGIELGRIGSPSRMVQDTVAWLRAQRADWMCPDTRFMVRLYSLSIFWFFFPFPFFLCVYASDGRLLARPFSSSICFLFFWLHRDLVRGMERLVVYISRLMSGSN